MTVQVDSQPVTDQNMWCVVMCCINNFISCLEKKTTLGTHDQTCYVTMCYVYWDYKLARPELIGVHPSYATLVLLV